MKVLIIHNAGNSKLPSGELTVVNNDVEALRQKGVRVHLHVVNSDSVTNVFSLNAIWRGLNIFWSYGAFRRTKELIERYQPDIVHFHSILPILTPSAFCACKVFGIPVVQTLHNYRWFCVEGGMFSNDSPCEECLEKGALRGIIKRCARHSLIISTILTLNNAIYVKSGVLFNLVDQFVAVSSFVKDKHIQAGFPQNKIVIKYNEIALQKSPDIDTLKVDRSGVVFVGRLAPAKGTKTLMEIISELRGLQFYIIGDGPDFARIKGYCKAGNFEDVRFAGRVDSSRVYEVISKSACVVIPSVSNETFGCVAAEAMACGTPVVASKVGGLAEIVERSGGGITVDPASPAEFASAIRSIISSPEKIKKMGLAGRNFAKNYLTPDISANRLLDIYRQVIGKKENPL